MNIRVSQHKVYNTNNKKNIYEQIKSNEISPRQFLWPVYRSSCFVSYSVSFCGDESGVDRDKDKGVGVCKGDCEGLKLGVSETSK